MSTQPFAEVLAGIWERSKQAIHAQVASLEQATCALEADTLDDAMRHEAERNAHKLAGSIGAFGFTEGTRLARAIEQVFQAGPTSEQAAHLHQLVAALHQDLSGHAAVPSTPAAPPTPPPPLLLAIAPDLAFLEAIALAASLWGRHVQTATSLASATQALTHTCPQVVLLALEVATSSAEIVAFLCDLAQRAPTLPLVLLGSDPTILEQLVVVTTEIRSFLQLPATPAHILEIVLQVSRQSAPPMSRVLFVTDDRQALTAFQQALAAHQHIGLTTVQEAASFWQVFTNTAPDLLVLDTTTPALPGLTWCQMIRCLPQGVTLPIILLTANTEVDAVEQALQAGADDYVSKPLTGQDLTVRIIQRLARSRQFAVMLGTDLLTGLPTWQKAVPLCNHLLSFANRVQQPFTLARLTLDHFTRLSKRHGHARINDSVRYFSVLLVQSFRKADVVARWSDDTFVVGLPGMPQAKGVERLVGILETLRYQTFVGRRGTPLQLTFRAGVATSPQDGTDLERLTRATASAIARARLDGGVQVCTTS